jgi:hypothetical protein
MITGLLALMQPSHDYPVPPGCRLIGTTSRFHRTHNLSRFTFLHPAYQLSRGRKQADAGLRCSASPIPSVILEVGSSESLMQLQTDAKLWIEDLPEVCQFLFLLPLLIGTLLDTTSYPALY